MNVTEFDRRKLSRFKQAYQSARERGVATFLFEGQQWDRHHAVQLIKHLERCESLQGEVPELRRKAIEREEALLAEALHKKRVRPQLVVVSSFGARGWGQVLQA